MVTFEDIKKALIELGIEGGDILLVHSSLKSFGRVENGADDVIDALLSEVSEEGTVVVPTLAMKNFIDAYKTWNIDKPSDTGLITEVFRKRPEAKRSNQATHSVAAIGKNAEFLTKTHGESGLRIGTYGNTPFAADSPWQKLYDMNAKVIMIGVTYEKLTLRHLCEYTLVEKALNIAKEKGKYEEFVKYICTFEQRPFISNEIFWPYLNHIKFEEEIYKNNFSTETVCGEAVLKCIKAKDVCDYMIKYAWEHPEEWYEPHIADWYLRAKAL